MNAYRLCFIDDHGARRSAFDFTSLDDASAIDASTRFGCERGADLWCGQRLVGSWRIEGASSQQRGPLPLAAAAIEVPGAITATSATEGTGNRRRGGRSGWIRRRRDAANG
jgi:hypothetical protein